MFITLTTVRAKKVLYYRSQDISKCLHSAASEGALETIQFLVERDADVNRKNRLGRTALICAAMNDHLEVVQYLVDNNADIMAQDDETNTALDWAKHNNNVAAITFLAEKH